MNGFSRRPDLQMKAAKLLSIAENMEEGNVNFKLEVKSTNDLMGKYNLLVDVYCLYKKRRRVDYCSYFYIGDILFIIFYW